MQRLILTLARLRTWMPGSFGALAVGVFLPVALQAYPSISQVSPTYGAPGGVVTILGSGFSPGLRGFF